MPQTHSRRIDLQLLEEWTCSGICRCWLTNWHAGGPPLSGKRRRSYSTPGGLARIDGAFQRTTADGRQRCKRP